MSGPDSVNNQRPQVSHPSLGNIKLTKPNWLHRQVIVQKEKKAATEYKVEKFIDKFQKKLEKSTANQDQEVRETFQETLMQTKQLDIESRNFILEFFGVYKEIDQKWKEVESMLDSYRICELIQTPEKKTVSPSGLRLQDRHGNNYQATFSDIYHTLDKRIDNKKTLKEIRELEIIFNKVQLFDSFRSKVNPSERQKLDSQINNIDNKLKEIKGNKERQLHTSDKYRALNEINPQEIQIQNSRIVITYSRAEPSYSANFLETLDFLSKQIDVATFSELQNFSNKLQKLKTLEQASQKKISNIGIKTIQEEVNIEIKKIQEKIKILEEKIDNKKNEQSAINEVFESKITPEEGLFKARGKTITFDKLYNDIYSRMNANPSLEELQSIKNDWEHLAAQDINNSSNLSHQIDALIIAKTYQNTSKSAEFLVDNSKPRKVVCEIDGKPYTTDFDALISAIDNQIDILKYKREPIKLLNVSYFLQDLKNAEAMSERPNHERAFQIGRLISFSKSGR